VHGKGQEGSSPLGRKLQPRQTVRSVKTPSPRKLDRGRSRRAAGKANDPQLFGVHHGHHFGGEPGAGPCRPNGHDRPETTGTPGKPAACSKAPGTTEGSIPDTRTTRSADTPSQKASAQDDDVPPPPWMLLRHRTRSSASPQSLSGAWDAAGTRPDAGHNADLPREVSGKPAEGTDPKETELYVLDASARIQRHVDSEAGRVQQQPGMDDIGLRFAVGGHRASGKVNPRTSVRGDAAPKAVTPPSGDRAWNALR